MMQEFRAVAFNVLMNNKPGWKMGKNLSPEQMVRRMEKAGVVRFSKEEREIMVEVVKEQKLHTKGENIQQICPEDQEKMNQMIEERKKKLKEEYLRDRKIRKEKLRKKKEEKAERIRHLIEFASQNNSTPSK